MGSNFAHGKLLLSVTASVRQVPSRAVPYVMLNSQAGAEANRQEADQHVRNERWWTAFTGRTTSNRTGSHDQFRSSADDLKLA